MAYIVLLAREKKTHWNYLQRGPISALLGTLINCKKFLTTEYCILLILDKMLRFLYFLQNVEFLLLLKWNVLSRVAFIVYL